MYLTVCPLRSPGSIPGRGVVLQEIFLWLITLCQPVLSQHGRKWLNPPHWHHTSCGHQEGRPKFSQGQTMVELKQKVQRSYLPSGHVGGRYHKRWHPA